MAAIKKKILKGIELTQYEFKQPPLVVGGLAMEYYGLRKTTHDYDYMVSKSDFNKLKKIHPEKILLLGGKNGDEIIYMKEKDVDLISTLMNHNYNDLSKGAINFKNFKIISLEKLLYIKTIEVVFNGSQKSKKDQKLIVNKIIKNKRK